MMADDPTRLPPQNLEAETCVLGAILLDNAAINKALEILVSDDFYRNSHRHIFRAMVALTETSEAVDEVTLTDYLRRRNELEQVGGATYLTSLANSVPTAANIAYHARIVREKALLRGLIHSATEIVSAAYQGRDPADVIVDQAEQHIFNISTRRTRSSFILLGDAVKEGFRVVEQLSSQDGHLTGIATGFPKLDELTGGLQPGDLVIVAGRPTMGKTAFALTIAAHAGIEHHKTVALFSLEMSKLQVVLRMLCSEARVDQANLRRGFMGREDWRRLTYAGSRLSDAAIFLDDNPSTSILEARAKTRRLKAERGLDFVIVDYLQLMRGTGQAENREKEISEISRGLKAMARELDVPVIAVSQLSRAVEGRAMKRPILADLRESGALEQDADVVLFIYRDEQEKGVAEVIIGKQRNGPTDTVRLAWLASYTRFEPLETRSL